MLIRPTKLEIPQDDPFKNDALERRYLEPTLTQFITQSSGSFVLALDASWGSGKTTFLEMWQVKLSQAGHACLYLNAWQNDFAPDPLIAIIGELTNAINKFADLPDQEGETKKAIKENMKKARKIAMAIGKRLIFGGIKLATYGVLDLDSNMEKTVVETTTEILESQTKDNKKSKIEDLISEYEECKVEIENFKEILAKIASQVAYIKESAKVVIIIDELDRCRPTYAIELLERVKHLFDASGVIFILGIDRSQLNHSIRSLYGSEFDATGYLRRFIDLDYRLPEPKIGNYCDYLFRAFGVEQLMSKRTSKSNSSDLKTLKLYLGGLMSAASMTLREQEQIVSRLRIALQTVQPNYPISPIMLSFLLFLREWNNSIYTNIIERKINVDDIITQIEAIPKIMEISTKTGIDIDEIEAHLLGILKDENLSDSRLITYEMTHKLDLEEPKVKKAKKIIEIMYQSRKDIGSFSAVFEKTVNSITLTNNFISYDS